MKVWVQNKPIEKWNETAIDACKIMQSQMAIRNYQLIAVYIDLAAIDLFAVVVAIVKHEMMSNALSKFVCTKFEWKQHSHPINIL